ncbi:Vacuolar protein-sorting-associated protein 27 [Ceratocystis pirilliformis]|uniref:Vacuolar protein sorting-associated protein 27 n=1 Tax=Ceratocystis pirilliformis TaxID=259994 RepID=A0ABR3YK83_9PEZI
MMGWWSSSANTALDEQIEKATSSSLEDIALNLEISDVIRSKAVQPKEAMRSLKKRIDNKNPNTQLSALNLTDTCIKNGGDHFLREIASREFMDNLKLHLEATGPIAINANVKAKILELIQAWAIATEGRYELIYITTTYRTLNKDGFEFPPKTAVASSMIDSSAPPEWADSEICMRCRTAFTFTNRKHHCRNCGNVFDHQCSSKTLPLPHLGITDPVRVDDGCYEKLTTRKAQPAPSDKSPTYPHKTRSTSALHPRNARVDPEDNFDEDLKKALAMSLEEVRAYSKGYAEPTRNTPKQVTFDSKVTVNSHVQDSGPSGPEEGDEDEDLRKAIAASLADMEEQKMMHSAALKKQTADSDTNAIPNVVPPKNDYELTPVEAENINLFSTLVERLQTQPPGTILREPQIQELYDSISALRPKLARTYGETMSKHETLLDLHAKLATVVRYYDRMLEERLSNAYSHHSISGYNDARQPSTLYSSMPPPPMHNPNGPAENFYSSNPTPAGCGPPPTHAYHQTPRAEYAAGYDKRVSSMPLPSQRPSQPPSTEAWQASTLPPETVYSQPPPAPLTENGHALAQQQNPQRLPSALSTDHNALYYHSAYHSNTPPADPPNAHAMSPITVSSPTQPSAPAPLEVSPPSSQLTLHQEVPTAPYWQSSASAPPPPSQAHSQGQGPQRQASWQQQQQHHHHQPQPQPQPQQQPLQQQHVPSGPSQPYNSYGAEAFPSAPQHVPVVAAQKPAVEEALIEF